MSRDGGGAKKLQGEREKEAEELKCCKKLSRSAVCALPYPATYTAIHQHPTPPVLVQVLTHT